MYNYKDDYKILSVDELKSMMDNNEDFSLVDVRTPEEYEAGHIKGAILLTDMVIYKEAKNVIPDKDKLVVVYCLTGKRSRLAAKELIRLGYKNVNDLGGVMLWPYEIVK